MRLSTFLLFNVAMTIIFFVAGYNNLIASTLFQSGHTDTSDLVNGTIYNRPPTIIDPKVDLVSVITGAIMDPAIGLGILGVGGIIIVAFAAFAFPGLFQGFAANFLVPAIIIILVMNIFFFPFSIFTSAGLPSMIVFAMFLLYNSFLIISTIDFLRGGM